jgi:phosphomannomutase
MKLLLSGGSWILIRESGTEPVARIYVEAPSKNDLSALAQAGWQLLEA